MKWHKTNSGDRVSDCGRFHILADRRLHTIKWTLLDTTTSREVPCRTLRDAQWLAVATVAKSKPEGKPLIDIL